MVSFDLLLIDEAATFAFAAALAGALAAEPLAEQSLVFHLSGELGAGKTALARAVLRGLGFSGAVKSPTFTLMETYNLTKFPVYHFDLYRFSSDAEWFDAGFDEILAGPGLVLVEWPQRAVGALARPDLLLELFAIDDNQRRLQASAFSERGSRCLIHAAPAASSRLPTSVPGASC